jgi:hypothetical protein
MIIVRLLSPGPWLLGTTKVYPGVGADIVMESITLVYLNQVGILSFVWARPWGSKKSQALKVTLRLR